MGALDIIECPHCGYEHDMAKYDFDGSDETDIECESEECEKEFEVIREWYPSYGAVTIDYYTCLECDAKERDCNMIRQKDNKYLCKSCYFKKEFAKLKG